MLHTSDKLFTSCRPIMDQARSTHALPFYEVTVNISKKINIFPHLLINRKISSIIFGCSEPVASRAANRLYSTIYTVEYTIYTQLTFHQKRRMQSKIWSIVDLNYSIFQWCIVCTKPVHWFMKAVCKKN